MTLSTIFSGQWPLQQFPQSVSQSVRPSLCWSHVVTSIRHLESVSSCFIINVQCSAVQHIRFSIRYSIFNIYLDNNLIEKIISNIASDENIQDTMHKMSCPISEVQVNRFYKEGIKQYISTFVHCVVKLLIYQNELIAKKFTCYLSYF